MLIRLFTSKCAFYVGDSTAKVVNSEQITTHEFMNTIRCMLVILPQRQLILSKSQLEIIGNICIRVGDSTAKVVNSEQITTLYNRCIEMGVLVILPQRQLILSKSQLCNFMVQKQTVGDSTAKVVNSEQITTMVQS